MNHLKKALLAGVVAVLLLLLVGQSTASAGLDITFIHEGTTNEGFILDGEVFPGTYEIIITALGNIGDREEVQFGWSIDHTAATIEIVGVGTLGILTPTRTGVNNSAEVVGFARADEVGAALFNGPNDSAFADWDMTTSIGPIHGDDGRLTQWEMEPFIETTGGRLRFFDAEDMPVAFTAIVEVPGPAPLALLPLAAVLCPRRRRRS